MILYDSDSDGVIIRGDAIERAEDIILKLEECVQLKPSLFSELEGLRCGFTRALARQDSLLDDRFLEALDAFVDIKNAADFIGLKHFSFLKEIYVASLD